MKFTRVGHQIFFPESIVMATLSGDTGDGTPESITLGLAYGYQLVFKGAEAAAVWAMLKDKVEDPAEPNAAKFGFF